MTIGSLFSGIGGLELGLERAGLGPVMWQCEIDPFALSVLARHWPEATRVRDVRDVSPKTIGEVSLICGGFPCQDVSVAGKGAGLAGERSGLWSEFRRVMSERLRMALGDLPRPARCPSTDRARRGSQLSLPLLDRGVRQGAFCW